MTGKILIAGIGNIFLGDDGFGVAVAAALARRNLPGTVLVKDFGIRGFDLAYALLEPWDAALLVDALARGEAPGTLYLLEPDLAAVTAAAAQVGMDPHGMDPVRVLALAASLGQITAPVTILGCEPEDFGDEIEGRLGLSAPVEAAIEEACNMVESLVERVLDASKLYPGKHDLGRLQTVER